LRDYGIEPQIWGGDENCEHQWGDDIKSISEQWKHSAEHNRVGDYDNPRQEGCLEKIESKTNFCQKCNAWRGCLGLEPHPNLYIEHLMMIFKEIRRVLKKSGSFYLNMGDSYFCGKGKSSFESEEHLQKRINDKTTMQQQHQGLKFDRPTDICKQDGNWLQPKQLLGIPERIMIAMQEDGWILRNKNIWYKRNPMPSSVKDRRNNVWEYLYHFVKNKTYYYDLDAIRVPHSRDWTGCGGNIAGKGVHKKHNGFEDIGDRQNVIPNPSGRNPGDVIHLSTQPFPDAHFATFPEDLVRDPILSSCPEWVCVKCGKARVRITKTNYKIPETRPTNPNIDRQRYSNEDKINIGYRPDKVLSSDVQTIGWTKCSCYTKLENERNSLLDKYDTPSDDKRCEELEREMANLFVGGIVLDCFGGSGTTGAMAVRLNRQFIVIDIKQEYCNMSNNRIGIELDKKRQIEIFNG